MKSLLLTCRHSPWSGLAARETLDIALSGGAFDLPVSMLWLGEGVLQLVAKQQSDLIEQKNLQAQLSALSLFGVESLYVAKDDLERFALQATDLILEPQVMSAQQIAELIAEHDLVVGL